MKFCYVDESGTGSEPFAVMVGVIVDASRMHITKQDWKNLLVRLSDTCGRDIKEFHTRDFYNGNNAWRAIDGPERAKIINEPLVWLKERKHKVTFTGVAKELFYQDKTKELLKDVNSSLWCFMGLHILLTIQKHFKGETSNKGNTIFIFDKEIKEEARFGELVNNPPEWTNDYYDKNANTSPLNQIIDVPYYGDSEDIHLIQVADLFAYLIRSYIELKEGKKMPKYKEEREKLDNWIQIIGSFSLPVASRYVLHGRGCAAELFHKYAPESIRNIGR